jgi:SAM-dependent methyltransferase
MIPGHAVCAPRHAAPLEERTKGGLHAFLLPTIESLDGLSSDFPILDLACGTGAWLKRLHDVGYRDLWGVDRDVQGFAAGDVSRFFPADLNCTDGILEKLGQRRFALVTMIEIIEHVADPARLVRLAYDALKPGGWMLITSPNIYSLRARVRFLLSGGVPSFERVAHSTPIELDHIHPVVLEAYQRKIFTPLELPLVRVWTYADRSGSRWFPRLTARMLRLVLSDELPGDSLCLLLRKPEQRAN